ncbi:MAG: AAA family ATPase [Ruminiclostridium sp.]|nr:AAA family ATPase [Ruminiclostridium sp.]
MSGKIVCFWGSPGSGKTIMALAVASALSKKKKNVIVFSGDKLTPSLKVYLPTVDITAQKSIGPLLMSNRYDDSDLATRMIVHPDTEYICFAGMAPSDNYITYQEFSRESVVRLANKFASYSDYVLIDGVSNPLEDTMTLAMLELSDVTVRSMTADGKGIMYSEANKTIYRDAKFRYDEQITVLGNVKEVSPYAEIIAIMGNFDYVLEYSYEAEDKMNAGKLLRDFNRSKGVKFEKTINKLTERIEGV